jgi:hypothetical protein
MRARPTSIYGVPALLILAGACAGLAWCEAGMQAPDDRALVERAARDYLEGWYAADPERVGRALHPDMVKRYVDALPGGRQVVHTLTRDRMIEMTRMGGGSKTPAEARGISVQVLEVSGDIAVARASSSEYMEYLSLARCNDQWVIVNILWRFQSPGPHPR